MKDISKILVREGILQAKTLDDKLLVVARAVSRGIDSLPEGALYEHEVQTALDHLRKQGHTSIKEFHPEMLVKPNENPNYVSLGIKNVELQEAIRSAVQLPAKEAVVEVRYDYRDIGVRQCFYNRIILFKQDDKLRQYIQSHISGPIETKVVYAFAVPDKLLRFREGSTITEARR